MSTLNTEHKRISSQKYIYPYNSLKALSNIFWSICSNHISSKSNKRERETRGGTDTIHIIKIYMYSYLDSSDSEYSLS